MVSTTLQNSKIIRPNGISLEKIGKHYQLVLRWHRILVWVVYYGIRSVSGIQYLPGTLTFSFCSPGDFSTFQNNWIYLENTGGQKGPTTKTDIQLVRNRPYWQDSFGISFIEVLAFSPDLVKHTHWNAQICCLKGSQWYPMKSAISVAKSRPVHLGAKIVTGKLLDRIFFSKKYVKHLELLPKYF